MVAPKPLREYKPLDPRLVTKTSLSRPRETISLALILWFSDGCPGAVEFGCESGDPKEGGIVDSSIVDKVAAYAANHDIELGDFDIKASLKGNPLLESQMESLNSAFELVWRLGTIAFADGELSRTAERKGGIRFRKRIRFSSNVDLICILFESAPNDFASVLLDWLTGGRVDGSRSAERRLIKMLEIFSESAQYKTGKGEAGTVFAIEGLYDALMDADESVEIVDRGGEAQGTTRILKSAISAGLYPALKIDGNSVDIDEKTDLSALRAYADRMKVSAEISCVKVESTAKTPAGNSKNAEQFDQPRNLIFFGAPGTGKSYQLNELAGESPFDGIRRVTFYPDYTYSQFVGCLRPVTRYGEPSSDEPAKKMKPYISYEFVPGPFLNTYIEAIQNPDRNYLLIVEEINRANPAAVFGDVFQLLDRDDEGRSVYEMALSEEMADYLRVVLPEYAVKACSDDPSKFLREQEHLAEESERLSLPSNMYIWATMNSADQGVFPMDTAFKRRWDFRYMGINEGEDADIDGVPLNEIEVPCGKHQVKWNNLRIAINNFMMSDELKINEDKLLGPFFVNPRTLTEDRFIDVFKDKVLLYLYEDAGKTKHSRMFRKGLKTYSQICDAFEDEGVGIFGSGFDERIVFPDEPMGSSEFAISQD